MSLEASASMPKNLLAQSLNFSPGTSLIGHFGSTDSRFKPLPSVVSDYPGPGAYVPLIHQVKDSSARWSWGTGAGHAIDSATTPSPGPGAHGTEQHPNGILTTLRRRWPGIASKSSFGSNEIRPLEKSDATFVPGPGQYNTEEASLFVSGDGKGTAARSPFVAQARARTGSRLQRDVDLKRKQLELRKDGGLETSFDSTAPRFRRHDDAPEADNPGPGAHAVSRYSAHVPSSRRPRTDNAARVGFHSTAERWHGGQKRDVAPNAVLAYLASAPEAQIGVPTHAQTAIGTVAARRAR